MKKLFLLIILAFSLGINAQEKSESNFKKTDEVLSEIAKKALIAAEKTGDFVIEQAPILLQEFYTWHIWSDVFFILFGITLIVFAIRLPYIWLSKEKSNFDYKYFNRYGDDEIIGAWIVCVSGFIIGFVVILRCVYDLTYIICAPKLYLIDYFIK